MSSRSRRSDAQIADAVAEFFQAREVIAASIHSMSSTPMPVVVTADPIGPSSLAVGAAQENVITIPCADPIEVEQQHPWLCWRELLGER